MLVQCVCYDYQVNIVQVAVRSQKCRRTRRRCFHSLAQCINVSSVARAVKDTGIVQEIVAKLEYPLIGVCICNVVAGQRARLRSAANEKRSVVAWLGT